MGHRGLWLFAIALLAGIALLLGQSCGRDDPAAVATPSSPASSSHADHDSPPSPQADAAAQAQASQRQQATSTAADTLHRYLAALSGDDRSQADAYWVDGRPPAQSNEADLRALTGLRALRIENRAPRPLDSTPVPTALEIPVELRASLDDAPNRHYRGWYRLRSLDPVNGAWQITSASIHAEAR